MRSSFELIAGRTISLCSNFASDRSNSPARCERPLRNSAASWNSCRMPLSAAIRRSRGRNSAIWCRPCCSDSRSFKRSNGCRWSSPATAQVSRPPSGPRCQVSRFASAGHQARCARPSTEIIFTRLPMSNRFAAMNKRSALILLPTRTDASPLRRRRAAEIWLRLRRSVWCRNKALKMAS